MSRRSLFGYLRDLGYNWSEDQASQMGAALAYYALFSLAPILILAIAVAGQVFGEAAARGHVVERIRGFTGEDSAVTVQTMLDNFRRPPTGPAAAVAGIASLLYGALGMFTQLRSSLARIWRLKPAGHHFLVALLKDYLLAFVMVLVSSVFVLALLTQSTLLGIVIERWGDQIPGDGWAWQLADFGLSSVLITLLFAFTFRFMSEGTIPYRDIWVGAALSAMLFAVGKMGIGFYLGYTRLASAYGTAGSLVVFLAWVYYSAQIFFIGAEVIRLRLDRGTAAT